jgi:NADPH:quinone reductase-like Zn-dependent oxidoreductase
MSNEAAWITEKQAKPLQVKEAPMPKAGPNEVVIKNQAVAINPVDWKIQEAGIFLQKYPNIIGTDVAGEIHEVGEGVTHVKKGDRVIAHAFSLLTNNPAHGAFQLYTLHEALVVAKLPSSIPFTSGCVLPLSISTASMCLFSKSTLGLPLPTSNPKDTGKSVLIWGGSSSVGTSAIQLAAAAGVKVVTTAGKHNLDAMKDLGAAEAFDYASSSVAENITSALQGTTFLGVCDCIGTPQAAGAWSPVYKKLGGRYASVLPDAKGLPDGIKGASVYAPMVARSDREVGEAVWGKWVAEALEKGTLKPKPDAIVVGKGLEDIQKGFDKQKEGVSFRKVVVEL